MKTKMLLAFALSLMLLFSVSSAAFAEAVPIEEASIVQAETPTQDELPAVSPQTGGNTPYFIGAGIAVLVFVGVAFYCKHNGNKHD